METQKNVAIKRIRTKPPVKVTFDDITEGLTDTDKSRLLEYGTKIQTRLFNIKIDIFEIGKILCDAKKTLQHGKFIPWIEYTFDNDLKYSTASFYMKVFTTFQDIPRAVKYFPSEILLMLTNKQLPDEALQLIKENANDISKTSLKEIKEDFTLFKKGKIGSNQFLTLTKEQIRSSIEDEKGSNIHRINRNARHSLEYGAGNVLKAINELRDKAHQMAGLYPYDPESQDHKKLMNEIDKIIEGLASLKTDLEGGRGNPLLKQISTGKGNKYTEISKS
jgi:hypothetical protein